MKFRTFFFCGNVAAFLSILSSPVEAATLVSDSFDTNPSNPNDVGWYASSGGFTTFSAASGGLQFTSSTNGTNQSVFKQFSETEVGIGQILTLSMKFTAMSDASNESNIWRIGLFNTSQTFTSNQTASPWTGIDEGYQLTISTSGSGNYPSNIYYRGDNNGIVSTSGSTSVSEVTGRIPGTGTAHLPLTMSLSVERISDTQVALSGYWQGGASQGTLPRVVLTSDTNFVSSFDTIYAAYGAGATGRGFTIDDVTLTLEAVPEPSLGALAALGLGAAVFRRRRSGI